jgi:two-component system cell cycle sensor histidine kinase PleC
LDDPLQKRYAGTGLGVPLAIAMTKLHSGSLHYESQLGVGTTAILKLPARRVLEDTDVSHGIRVLLPGGGNS